jgi:hypothetical protein
MEALRRRGVRQFASGREMGSDVAAQGAAREARKRKEWVISRRCFDAALHLLWRQPARGKHGSGHDESSSCTTTVETKSVATPSKTADGRQKRDES